MSFSPHKFFLIPSIMLFGVGSYAAIINPDITESSVAPTGVFVASYDPEVATGSISARNQVEGAARADRALAQGFTPVPGTVSIHAITVQMSGADATTNDWSTFAAGAAILKVTIYEAVDSGNFLLDGITPAGTLVANLTYDLSGSSVSADGNYLTFAFDEVAVNAGEIHGIQFSWNDDAVGNNGLDDDLFVFNVAETNPGEYEGGSRATLAANRPNFDWDLDAEVRVGDPESDNDLHFYVHGTVDAVTPTWAGYPVDENDWADTGDWLGWVYVGSGDVVYILSIDTWAFLKGSSVGETGAWSYYFR